MGSTASIVKTDTAPCVNLPKPTLVRNNPPAYADVEEGYPEEAYKDDWVEYAEFVSNGFKSSSPS